MMYTIDFPQIYPVTGHTDHVGQGSTFVAISGTKMNGIDFIPLALQKGAKKIVVQKDVIISSDLSAIIKKHEATVEFCDDVRKALSILSAQALQHPAKKLKIVGVTGTKGKTSTAYMMYHMLLSTGKKVALISTVEKRIGKDLVNVSLTTPLPDQLHMFFDLCVKHDVEYVVMEVSAQALSLQRVEGIEFEIGIFTNFSHEHLEFYKDLEEYFQAKKLFIDKVKDKRHFFINLDDPLVGQLAQQDPALSTFSLENKRADVYGCLYQKNEKNFLHVKVNDQTFEFQLPLIGIFNAYNMLGVVSALYAFGFDLNDFTYSLQTLPYVPGRMEQYHLQNGARCFIDYAHNPSSFEAVLSTLRAMTSHLIVVFGAAGNRDKQKRPIMGAIAQKYCDVVILTSDNPRDENPIVIAQDVEKGFNPEINVEFHKELNRVKAIELGYELTKQNSILAILGKGRDEYQIVGGLTFPFKERSIIKPFVVSND